LGGFTSLSQLPRSSSIQRGLTREISRDIQIDIITPRETQILSERQIQREIQRETTREVQREIQREIPRLTQRQTQRQTQRLTQRAILRTIQRNPPRPPIIPGIERGRKKAIIPRFFIKGTSIAKQLSFGFRSFVLRKGRRVYLRGIFPRGLALRKGELKAKQTLRATFGIEPTRIQVRQKDISYKVSEKLFRSYRIRKGKRTPLKDIYIQKNNVFAVMS